MRPPVTASGSNENKVEQVFNLLKLSGLGFVPEGTARIILRAAEHHTFRAGHTNPKRERGRGRAFNNALLRISSGERPPSLTRQVSVILGRAEISCPLNSLLKSKNEVTRIVSEERCSRKTYEASTL